MHSFGEAYVGDLLLGCSPKLCMSPTVLAPWVSHRQFMIVVFIWMYFMFVRPICIHTDISFFIVCEDNGVEDDIVFFCWEAILAVPGIYLHKMFDRIISSPSSFFPNFRAIILTNDDFIYIPMDMNPLL